MEFLFWLILIVLGIYWLPKRKQFPKQIKKMVDKKWITKDQAIRICHFEQEQQVKMWLKNHLITPEQADILLNPKSTVKNPSFFGKLSFVTAVCWLAIGCILLGILALIAANYEAIPPQVRFGSTLLGLFGVSMGCFYAYIRHKSFLLECLIVAGIGLIGANIATVSQLFHLSGKMENALFVWALLSLSFIVFSQKSFWAYLWYPTVFLMGILSDYCHILQNIWYHCIAFEISGVLGLLTIYLLARRYTQTAPLYRAFRFWAVLSGIILLAAFDARFTFMYQTDYSIFSDVNRLPAILSLITFAIYPIYVYRKNRPAVIGLMGMLFIGGISCFVQFPIMGICMTLFLLAMLAVYCAIINNLHAFNTVIGVIFVRLVLAYFHLFASLAVTGVGLILLGIMILVGIKLFVRYRSDLIDYMKRLK